MLEFLLTPQTSLKISSTDPTYVKLEHQGGTDIILSYARITVEQGGNRISYDPAGNSLSRLTAGDRGAGQYLDTWNLH
jgi:hypothetical protein